MACQCVAQNEWDKGANNPILELGKDGTWDYMGVSNPSVIFDGTTYKMWYTGFDGNMRIGYATSTDGANWTKCQGYILDIGKPGEWDSQHVANPSVIFDAGIYKMWYTGCDKKMQIGYATSNDGVHWEKYLQNPVIDIGAWSTCPDGDIWSPTVVFGGTEYRMWYSGWNGESVRIGYAISSDGISWTKNSSVPALETGTSGTWDYHYVCLLYTSPSPRD